MSNHTMRIVMLSIAALVPDLISPRESPSSLNSEDIASYVTTDTLSEAGPPTPGRA